MAVAATSQLGRHLAYVLAKGVTLVGLSGCGQRILCVGLCVWVCVWVYARMNAWEFSLQSTALPLLSFDLHSFLCCRRGVGKFPPLSQAIDVPL